MTLDTIVYDIAEKMRGENNPAFRERLKFEVLVAREFLLSQDYQRNQKLSSAFFQEITCLPVRRLDASECPDILSGYEVSATDPIPQPIAVKNWDHIQVYNINRTKNYSHISVEQFQFMRYRKYSMNEPVYYFKDNRIYLFNTHPRSITVSGIFTDPRELFRYSNCEGYPCYNFDSEFPVTGAMIQRITDMVFKSNAQTPNNSDDQIREETQR